MIFVTPAFAYQDYIIVSNRPVKFVYSDNRNIVTVKPLYTIGNERNILILHALSEGRTFINVNFEDSKTVLKVKIDEKQTVISPKKGFEYFEVDEPPYELDILEPPMLGGQE